MTGMLIFTCASVPHVSANWWYCAAEGGYCDDLEEYVMEQVADTTVMAKAYDNSHFGNPHYRQRKHAGRTNLHIPHVAWHGGNPGSY